MLGSCTSWQEEGRAAFSGQLMRRWAKIRRETIALPGRKPTEIENLVGWKRYERIKRRIEEKVTE